MVETTRDWKTALGCYNVPNRNPLVPANDLKIIYEQIDAEAQNSGEASATTSADWSTLDDVMDLSVVYGEDEFATMELHEWLLDDSLTVMPSTIPSTWHSGWVGNTLSGSDKSYSTHPKFIMEWNEKQLSTIGGLTLKWASRLNEYASSFIITAYDGITPIATKTFSCSEEDYFAKIELVGYDKIEIEVVSWCLPYRRARLENVTMGLIVEITKTDVLSLEHSMSSDLLSFALPDDYVTFEMDNVSEEWNPDSPSGRYEYLLERQKLILQYAFKINGSYEWHTFGTYFMAEWQTPQNGISATFTGRSLVEFMSMAYDASQLTTDKVYTEYEYLNSNGGQWIDTGYTHKTNTWVSTKFKPLDMSNYRTFYGGASSDNSTDSFTWGWNASGGINADLSTVNPNPVAGTAGVIALNQEYTFVAGGAGCYINGTYYPIGATIAPSSITDGLFCRHLSSGWSDEVGIVAMGRTQIYEGTLNDVANSTLIHDYIPVQRADGVYGMYDVVTDTFKTNGGSGAFTATNEVGAITTPYHYGDSVSLKTLAENAFSQSHLPTDADGTVKWDVDASLADIDIVIPYNENEVEGVTTYEWNFPHSCAEVIQLVANAGCCIIRPDVNGTIHIEPISEVRTDYLIDRFVAYQNSEYEITKELRAVNINNGQKITSVSGVINGEEQGISNELIQDDTRCSAVSTWTINVLGKRKLLNGEFRADPRLEPLDIITNDNKFARNFIWVTSVKWNYSGAFNGSYEGRIIKSIPLENTEGLYYAGETYSGGTW